MLPLTSYAWGSPGRYIQGAGELDRLAIHTEIYKKAEHSLRECRRGFLEFFVSDRDYKRAY